MRQPTLKQQRAAVARQQADELKAKKLHVIAERRAKAHGMNKIEFIAGIVKGKFRPITADDLAKEPNPD